jgi:lysophospholipase L1-like esterase
VNVALACRKPEKLITVVFMGGSITEGQHVSSLDRWVDIVTSELVKSSLDSQLSNVTRGICGETTRQGLERFPADVQAHTPDLVTIQFGLNDYGFWAAACFRSCVSRQSD